MNTHEFNVKVANGEFVKLHTSRARGYVSRKAAGKVVPYSGRFGEGCKLLTPAWDSTRYCYVTYYIAKQRQD